MQAHQVKVNGFRVELGEVEAGLAAIEGVRDVLALPVARGLNKEKPLMGPLSTCVPRRILRCDAIKGLESSV